MPLNKFLLVIAPVGLMIAACLGLTGSETWLARFGNSPEAQLTLGRIGIALPMLSPRSLGLFSSSPRVAPWRSNPLALVFWWVRSA